ncbi:MAG: enoyl-CoA hydratase [Burkholderiales bacterium]
MNRDLLETCEHGVATLTLNRPERLNAFSAEMLAGLREALARLATDASVRVLVLTGAGRGFCAGGDIKRMASGAIAYEAPDAVSVLREKMELSRALYDFPKPTLASVNGPAAGAGLAIALACDLRIAGASARFTTAFARIGLPGDFGGSYFLSALVGPARAHELYLTGDTLDASRALAYGLVNRVVPDADLAAETASLAARLAAGPPVAYAYMKRNLRAARTETLARTLDLEAEHQIAASRTEDHAEAARAFVEKRPPAFTGS